MMEKCAMYSSVEDYVERRGGNRVIKKILVANNGIGAVKAIRSMRRWAYETFEDERAVQFVAMATPEDLRANAEYIRMADEVVDVPGGANNNNYANVMLIVEIAERWRVDAVWAGWGHASENPLLPDALAATARKIVFIGPSGPPMRALGDKIGSTIIAQSAGVPTISWNGDGLQADYRKGGIPPDVYASANVTSAAAAAEACERIGFPVMIKASEGGGGKGIRKVLEAASVSAAYRQVASEVPGSPVFVMKLAPRSRHLEVQLLADTYGQAIALNGRDCSIQRRHQKIIEEGPPVVASDDVWYSMERSAVNLAKEVGYCNAGTVEYLYTLDDDKFYFLELNPRLQVEHPVTEMITKVNLPAAQLQVAMGIPLHLIPDIRRLYGRVPHDTEMIDFDTENRPNPSGHCIAVRITAENPDQGFQPTSGTIKELNFRSTPEVWGYFSVDSSGLVHEFADSQFGHLFAEGTDREASRRHMTVALKELSIRGDIRTTVEYIGDVLTSGDFINNRIDTGWLDKRIAAGRSGSSDLRKGTVDAHMAVVVGGVIHGHQDAAERLSTFQDMLGKGLLPPKKLLVTWQAVDLIYEGVKYRLKVSQTSPQTFAVTTLGPKKGGMEGGRAGGFVEAHCRELADGGFLLVINGKSQVVYVNNEASGLRLAVNGSTVVFTKEYDPACLDTDVAGKLARRLVADGTHVNAGDAYCEVEVMKMYMPLCVQESGIVRWHLSEGATLKPGDRLATLELDDPSAVVQAEVFEGELSPVEEGSGRVPAGGPAVEEAEGGDKMHVALGKALGTLGMVLQGFEVPKERWYKALMNARQVLQSPLLPLHEFEQAFSVLSGRINGNLHQNLLDTSNRYKASLAKMDEPSDGAGEGVGAGVFSLPREVLGELDKFSAGLDGKEKADMEASVVGLRGVMEKHGQGPAGRVAEACRDLVQEYLDVERSFAGVSMEVAMGALRKAHTGDDAVKVFNMFRSHSAVSSKNTLLLELLKLVREVITDANYASSTEAPSASRSGGAEAVVSTSSGVGVGEVEEGEKPGPSHLESFLPVLTELSNLHDTVYGPVAGRARQLLIEQGSPSLEQRRETFVQAVEAVASAGKNADITSRQSLIDSFVGQGAPIRDLLAPLLSSDDLEIGKAAAEIYVRRIYRTHMLGNFKLGTVGGVSKELPCLSWTFKMGAAEAFVVGMGKQTGSYVDLQTRNSSGQLNRVGSGLGLSGVPSNSSGELTRAGSGLGLSGVAESSKGRKDWTVGNVPPGVERCGVFAVLNGLEDLDTGVEETLSLFMQFKDQQSSSVEGPVNALHVFLLSSPLDPQAFPSDGEDRQRLVSLASSTPLANPAGGAGAGGAGMVDASMHTEDFLTVEALREAIQQHQGLLAKADVRRVTFVAPSLTGQGDIPGIFTFRAVSDFVEDSLFRHIEPSHAFHLDLPRLSNFYIRVANTSLIEGGNVHVYVARPKDGGKVIGSRSPHYSRRYFARVASEVVGRGQRYYMEQMFMEAINAIDMAVAEAEHAAHKSSGGVGSKQAPPPSNNHIFINAVVPDPHADPEMVAEHMKELFVRFQSKIQRLGIAFFEVRIVCRMARASASRLAALGEEPEALGVGRGGGAGGGFVLLPISLVASNPTGYVVRVDTYAEVQEDGKTVFRSIQQGSVSSSRTKGEWEGLDVSTPYPVHVSFEDKRLLAQARSETLYCYDFLELLEEGVRDQWATYAKDRPQGSVSVPPVLMTSRELVVRRRDTGSNSDSEWTAADLDNLELVESGRGAGLNDVGMVVWLVTLMTPEYKGGRQVVMVANDITWEAGSFGTREDVVFLLASRLARERGLPRIYLAANSGARIGMAESLKKHFRVAWADPEDPTLGYRYLYLTPKDHEDLSGKGAVICEEVMDEGERRFKIVDIIGEEPDLGVENLQGSGRIAGETSLAYRETFTLTLVVGRTVGIGAYLVRLGQRTVQNASAAPILLTGYQALNTLMGREVYTSNDQLGGAQVMIPNGISHGLADSHTDAVAAALQWLSYVPCARGAYLPVVDISGVDVVEREVAFTPQKGVPCDPRHMVAGTTGAIDNHWLGGIFDKGSFTETLAGWAEAVVTGRARLGGIPVGVIATEGRMREKMCPADPADVTSHERMVQQAGGVWYPDSAYKTAQAIRDMNLEGLPLMVFANWRGFSGGQRDMFDEILKYGALIVDALVEYRQPVFVYIPPHAELRGGAWVVVDSTINADVMEMYAADGARGGVLEANGAASIKFREKDMLKTAHRLDPVLLELDAKLKALTAQDAMVVDDNERTDLTKAIEERETRVIGVYRQVAIQFADLHDTPGRMVSRGVIRREVPWAQARTFFYWRLRRRLAEFDLRAQVRKGDPSVSATGASALLEEWFNASRAGEAGASWEDDKEILKWMDSDALFIKDHISAVKFKHVSAQVESLAAETPSAVLDGLCKVVKGLDKETRKKLLDRLNAAASL